MFKFFPNSTFYWSRHVVCSFTQSALDYSEYPSDTQNFSLVLQSYGYSSYLLDTNFISNTAVTLVANFQNGEANIEQNQLWSYQSYTAYTEDILQPNFANPTRTFSMALINLLFKRQSDGISVRFLIPLAMLIMMSALTYWIYYENRVDITITILVSVSALYIVILQNLPMVGYLTNADRFIFWVSLLPASCVCVVVSCALACCEVLQFHRFYEMVAAHTSATVCYYLTPPAPLTTKWWMVCGCGCRVVMM